MIGNRRDEDDITLKERERIAERFSVSEWEIYLSGGGHFPEHNRPLNLQIALQRLYGARRELYRRSA